MRLAQKTVDYNSGNVSLKFEYLCFLTIEYIDLRVICTSRRNSLSPMNWDIFRLAKKKKKKKKTKT